MTTLIPKYYQGSAGSVNRAINLKLAEIISVLDFGADPTGATDSTAAMQAAHNTGKTIFYPAGTYKFTSITMSTGGIVGAGVPDTILAPYSSATSTAITCSTTTNVQYGPTFMNFLMQPTITKTAGAMIAISASGSGNYAGTQIENVVMFQSIFNGITIDLDANWFVTNCTFANISNACITIQNSNNPDSGGGSITNSVFKNGGTGGNMIGILQYSAGGQITQGNSFLGMNYHYKIAFNATTNNSADFIFQNNYCGLAVVSCIDVSRTVTNSYVMSGIQIIGNKFEQNVTGSGATCIKFNTSSANYVNGVYIQSNVFWPGNGNAIVLNNVNGPKITGNSFLGNNNASYYAYTIASTCVNTYVAGNNFDGFLTSGSNSGPSGSTFIDGAVQSGSSTATTNAAYGSLYTGASATITFPCPYQAAPNVIATLVDGTGSGGISAMVGNVTATTFVVNVVGVTNAKALQFNWQASGQLSVGV